MKLRPVAFVGALFAFAVIPAKAQTTAPDEPMIPLEGADTSRVNIEDAGSGSIEEFSMEELLNPKVVTASRSAEPLREAPVPITIITSEMIRASASRQLMDVLTAYVPGMTFVADANEANIAMRGVYGSAQQKILIMVDGHRLNQRAYLAAPPDYGISINPDKVARIEVLRGPGSSVYGNVALTAVINIVTKEGKELDGLRAVVGGGNYGQVRLDMAYGKQFAPEHDLTMWATVYRAKGEGRNVDIEDDYSLVPRGGEVVISGARQPENYDVGLRYRIHDWAFYAQMNRSGWRSTYSDVGRLGEVYDYTVLRSFEGIKNGLYNNNVHTAIDYNHVFNESWSVTGQLGFDAAEIRGATVTNSTNGRQTLSWNERGINGFLQVKYDYIIGGLGRGNAFVGVAADVYQVYDSMTIVGANGALETVNDVRGRELLRTGSEGIYSTFAQVKQHLGGMFLLNVGARLDYKVRRGPVGDPFPLPNVDDITDVSPRAALIFNPADEFDVKLSYAESFVDAPYWYRYNNIPSYQGAVDLKPEKQRSLQLTPTVRLLDGLVISTTNFSYNRLSDGVFRVPDANIDPANPVYYTNAGDLKTATVEEEVAFNTENLRLRANATFFYVLDVENYTAFDDASEAVEPGRTTSHKVWHVPMFYGALVASGRPLLDMAPSTWLDVIVRYVGDQQAPIQAVSINKPDASANLLNKNKARVILDAQIRSGDLWVKGLSLSANVHNLLNHTYGQGGTTRFPYPQEGRWFMVQLGYAFSP